MKSFLRVGVFLVVIALLILGNLKAWGADWKYIEETYAGKFFYDADNIRPSKDIGRV